MCDTICLELGNVPHIICKFQFAIFITVSYTTIYITASTSHMYHNTCIILGFAIIMFALDCMLGMQAVYQVWVCVITRCCP